MHPEGRARPPAECGEQIVERYPGVAREAPHLLVGGRERIFTLQSEKHRPQGEYEGAPAGLRDLLHAADVALGFRPAIEVVVGVDVLVPTHVVTCETVPLPILLRPFQEARSPPRRRWLGQPPRAACA